MTTIKLTKGIQVDYQTALTEKQLRRMIRKAEKDKWTVEIIKSNQKTNHQ